MLYSGVSFLGRLGAGNRLTVSVEVRWMFRLEPGEVYHVSVEFEDWGSAEFYARLQKGGQLMVPIEIVRSAELGRGELMKVYIQVRDEK